MGAPDCPTWLGPVAREEWQRIVPALDEIGMLSRVDYAALVVYVELWQEYIHLRAYVVGRPVFREPMDEDDKNALPMPRRNVALKAMNDCRDRLLRYMGEFGLTPSSRASLAGADDAPRDDFETFVLRGAG